jgi:GT2 family glycosyltransferase
MASKISVVMTAYKRSKLLANTLESIKMQTRQPDQIVVVEDGFDGGATQGVCIAAKNEGLPVEYYCRSNRPNLEYSNASVPKNISIRKAIGDILIIQCAEVKYTGPNDIANLIRPVEECGAVSSFAYCQALDELGGFQEWYAGPERCAGWFLDFCQCVRREHVEAIRGFDEGYIGYGYEDDDFAFRLQQTGVQYRWAPEVVVQHQYHPIYNKNTGLSERGKFRLEHMKRAVNEAKKREWLVANKNFEWGSLKS